LVYQWSYEVFTGETVKHFFRDTCTRFVSKLSFMYPYIHI